MPATSSGHLPEERYLRREIAFDLDLDPEIDDEPVVILRSVPAEPTELAVSGVLPRRMRHRRWSGALAPASPKRGSESD